MSILAVVAACGLLAAVAGSIQSSQPVLACRPKALTAVERKQYTELLATLRRGTTHVSEDPEGFTFHYAADIAPAEVVAWVELERKCCPFARFTLEVPEDGGLARLRMWGGPGVKAVVAAELDR